MNYHSVLQCKRRLYTQCSHQLKGSCMSRRKINRTNTGLRLIYGAVVTLLLIVGAGTAMALNSGDRSAFGGTTTTMANVDAPTSNTCTTTFPSGLVLQTGEKTTTNIQGQFQGQLQERLFTVTLGSTASICVSYQVNSAATLASAASITEKFFGAVYTVNAGTLGGGWEYNYTGAPGVTVTANPTSIVIHPGGNSTILVTYTISTSSSSAGYYNLEYFNQCPAFIPFAILGSGQEVSSSNFQGFFQPLDCPQDPIMHDGVVTGISNMNVSWVSG
jgi:hypothetical protein